MISSKRFIVTNRRETISNTSSAQDAASVDAIMNQLPNILRPAVRKGPRYSVRPFYTTLLVFAALVALSWAVRSNIIGQSPRRTTTNVLLARRENEPEVQCIPVHPLYR